MADVQFTVNGQTVLVPQGTTIAAALMNAGLSAFRRSPSGSARGPLCGMGICYECRVTIDGQPHCLSCQTPCRAGMVVVTE